MSLTSRDRSGLVGDNVVVDIGLRSIDFIMRCPLLQVGSFMMSIRIHRTGRESAMSPFSLCDELAGKKHLWRAVSVHVRTVLQIGFASIACLKDRLKAGLQTRSQIFQTPSGSRRPSAQAVRAHALPGGPAPPGRASLAPGAPLQALRQFVPHTGKTTGRVCI